MPARTQEIALAISFNKQSAIQTAVLAASLWSLKASSFNPAFPVHNQETDAEDFNKGDEFATQVFPVSLDASWEWPYFLSSQNWAQVIAFALGKFTETSPDTGAYQYVATLMDPATDGVEPPAATIVSGIRAGTAGEMLDLALIGMKCDSFTLRLQSGPGRQNATLNSRWTGCGKYSNNSGLTIPALTAETLLNSAGATSLTINGIDYLSAKTFVDLEFSYNNNLMGDAGFYPGSGVQSSAGGDYAIRGRLEYGTRSLGLTFQARLEAASTELATLLAGTEGTATITVRGPLIAGSTYHTAKLEFHRIRFKGYTLGETNGFVTVQVVSEIMKHNSNGVLTLTGVTTKTGIGSAAA